MQPTDPDKFTEQAWDAIVKSPEVIGLGFYYSGRFHSSWCGIASRGVGNLI
nr:hypothetical protein [Spirulina major]